MSDEKNDDLTPSEIEAAVQYKGEMNQELLLMKQMNRIAVFREINDKQYAGAVDNLGLMVMKDLRSQVDKKRSQLGLTLGSYNGMNEEKKVLYDKLWVSIMDILEDSNIIYRKSSFGRGKF